VAIGIIIGMAVGTAICAAATMRWPKLLG
jgi:hypothetical protein